MMGNKETIRAVALEVLENLGAVMPIFFKDISNENRDKLLSNIEDWLWSYGEWVVTKFSYGQDSSEAKHKETVKDACLSAILSRLGIVENDAKKKLVQVASLVVGKAIGTVIKGV